MKMTNCGYLLSGVSGAQEGGVMFGGARGSCKRGSGPRKARSYRSCFITTAKLFLYVSGISLVMEHFFIGCFLLSWSYSACLLPLDVVGANVAPTRMGDKIVETQYGRIRGVVASLPGEHLPQVERYLGLQYASILGGDLRFMPPTSPMHKWEGVRSATKLRPACPQRLPDLVKMRSELPEGRINHFEKLIPFLKDQDEECLNLNVYVPALATNESEPLPVVVFIHGETYEIGTGNAYDGSVMAAFGHVIVVTLNYRLGVLGFMSVGDSNAPGNYALLDQVAALHWVRENIAGFGGNPDEVILLGQGYGAALVNLLLISPVTKGRKLFKRAIIQSGSALSTWAINYDPLLYTKELAEHVNCSSCWGNSAQLVQCFKSKPYEDLLRVDIKAPKYYSAWAPVIDHRSVLPADIHHLMMEPDSEFRHVNILLGVMKNEGFLEFREEEIAAGVQETRMKQILRTYVRNVYQYQRQKIYEILYHHYTNWEKPHNVESIRDNLMDLLGDGQITSPMMELTQIHSAAPCSTYFYSFTYPSRLDTYPRWAGGVHGDDMTYVFGAPLTDGVEPFLSSFTRSEKMLSEAVLTYWTNFIHSGSPNNPSSQESIHGGRVENRFTDLIWPEYDSTDQQYIQIGMKPMKKTHYRASQMALWLDLIPKLHQSEGLDAIHHLLTDYNNASSFEEEGTMQLDRETLQLPTPIPPEIPYPTSTSSPPSTTSTTTTTTTTTTTPVTTTRLTTTIRRKSTSKYNIGSINPTRYVLPPSSSTDESRDASISDDSKLSLSVTIAVGCSLLFLNILIFAGVYYQKDRMRQELKSQRRELEKEKESCHADNDNVDNDNVKASTSPETDTNSSSMPTPPMAHNRHLHLYHPQSPQPEPKQHGASNTLPKHPIPVEPPQAPYSTLPRSSPGRHHVPCDHHAHLDHHYNVINHSSAVDADINCHHGNPSTVV